MTRTLAILTGLLVSAGALRAEVITGKADSLQGVLLSPVQLTPHRLARLRDQQIDTVVLALEEEDGQSAKAAARAVIAAGLGLAYWIEIGRSESLAEAHPEWMGSIQSHPEWRRFHPDFPEAGQGEVVKTWPWVPVLYEETFPVHLNRVRDLLDGLPPAASIFLNDLQGPPTACGCGHSLCRWTTDYGRIRTATRLPDDAAAKFLDAVGEIAPQSEIIPVWATECEEGDHHTHCGGVGCFKGKCWYEFTKQLTHVAKRSERIGLLTLFREFDRDLERYGPVGEAGWVARALELMKEMPPKRGGEGLPANRFIAVLQGWEVSAEEIEAQKRQAKAAGAAGWILAEVEIEQSWEPRIHRLR